MCVWQTIHVLEQWPTGLQFILVIKQFNLEWHLSLAGPEKTRQPKRWQQLDFSIKVCVKIIVNIM